MGKTNDAGAARREERIAVGQLQLRQSLPPGGLRFDLAGLRQPASSASASSDLGHFGSRRKAFESGREHGAGVGEAGGRLIELRQRQRGAQFEAARPLSCFATAMRGQEGLFRGRGIGWASRIGQDFASHPIAVRLRMRDGLRDPPVASPSSRTARARSRSPPCSFSLSQRNFQPTSSKVSMF